MYACVWALTNGKTEVWANERVCADISICVQSANVQKCEMCVSGNIWGTILLL